MCDDEKFVAERKFKTRSKKKKKKINFHTAATIVIKGILSSFLFKHIKLHRFWQTKKKKKEEKQEWTRSKRRKEEEKKIETLNKLKL